jgi:ribosomal protein S27E|mmetsp:Transcript_37321/g.101034  ORF Transcript_37321/g.101034 Transcript_37321/m.101034 type:complete len:146 (+) Transcript_37321:491-928(+)
MPSSCTILEHTSTPRSRSTSAPQDMEEKGAVLDKLNEASLLSWKHKSLFSCNNCGRTFQKDKLPLHQKGCHAQDRTHKIEIMAQGGRLVEGSTMHMFAKVVSNFVWFKCGSCTNARTYSSSVAAGALAPSLLSRRTISANDAPRL